MNDVGRNTSFFPFRFQTPLDRVRALACLAAFRRRDLPVPLALGALLTASGDDALQGYYEDVCGLIGPCGALHSPDGFVTARNALGILGFFHGVLCLSEDEDEDEDCLGRRIFLTMQSLGPSRRENET